MSVSGTIPIMESTRQPAPSESIPSARVRSRFVKGFSVVRFIAPSGRSDLTAYDPTSKLAMNTTEIDWVLMRLGGEESRPASQRQIAEWLARLRRFAGCISAPTPTSESLRREVFYE